MHTIIKKLSEVALIKQIFVGLVIGILIAVFLPAAIPGVAILGSLFVKALKGVAPILVFFLVMNAMATKREDGNAKMKPIIVLYIIGTFFASLVAVFASFMFPSTLHLQAAQSQINPPSGIISVISTLINNVVDNPVNALITANYIGILAWAIVIGIALRPAGESTKKMLEDAANAITQLVQWVIRFAPLGILGLVADSIGQHGLSSLLSYIHLLAVLLGAFFFVALVMNPLIVYMNLHRNPYPLVWMTLRESGLYAFFTRSSAANIPVNLNLCRKLGLDYNTYTVSIPLGATVNMIWYCLTAITISLSTTGH